MRKSLFPVLVLLSFASRGFSADTPLCYPCPCPNQQPAPGSQPGTSAATDQTTQTTPQTPDNLDFSGAASTGNQYASSNVPGTAFAGLGVANATGGTGSTVPLPPTVTNSAILPGLFTAATAQSAIPVDQIFSSYSYYSQFQFVRTAVGGAPVIRGPGFNLNVYEVGFEKTIFGGLGSVYCDAPFLEATDNVTDVSPNFQKIDGAGDITFGFKFLLLHDECTGNALTAGVSVAAPTAQPGRVITSENFAAGVPTPPSLIPPSTTIASVNPTFIQPWVAATYNLNRFTMQEYVGALIPSDHDVVSTINDVLAVSYLAYSDNCSCSRISSVSPFVSAQLLAPLGRGASPGLPVSFSTQVFVTEGLQAGLGERLSVYGGVEEPVVGPKAFSIGAEVGSALRF